MLRSKIDHFDGQYRFLSNFYPCEITFNGRTATSLEHAYQASKALYPHDRDYVLSQKTAGQAKRAGRKVEIVPDWEKRKIDVMRTLVREKFIRHPDLCVLLIRTGDAELVEGNSWRDVFWGVDSESGEGENHLGKILMEVRAELRALEGKTS